MNDEVDATQVAKPGFDDSCNTTTTANEKLCDDKIQRSDRKPRAPGLVFNSPAACLRSLQILLLIGAGAAKQRAGKQAEFIAVIGVLSPWLQSCVPQATGYLFRHFHRDHHPGLVEAWQCHGSSSISWLDQRAAQNEVCNESCQSSCGPSQG